MSKREVEEVESKKGVYQLAFETFVHNKTKCRKGEENAREYGSKWVRNAGRAHTKIIFDDITDRVVVRCHDTDVISINTLADEMTLDMTYLSKSTKESIQIGLAFIRRAGFGEFYIIRKNWEWKLFRDDKEVHTFGHEKNEPQKSTRDAHPNRVVKVEY
jgi:hypothetical protein